MISVAKKNKNKNTCIKRDGIQGPGEPKIRSPKTGQIHSLFAALVILDSQIRCNFPLNAGKISYKIRRSLDLFTTL